MFVTILLYELQTSNVWFFSRSNQINISFLFGLGTRQMFQADNLKLQMCDFIFPIESNYGLVDIVHLESWESYIRT